MIRWLNGKKNTGERYVCVLRETVKSTLIAQERREAREEEKRRKGSRRSKEQGGDGVSLKSPSNLRDLALSRMRKIQRKFQGMSGTVQPWNSFEQVEKKMNTSNMVEALIREATDTVNLVSYIASCL